MPERKDKPTELSAPFYYGLKTAYTLIGIGQGALIGGAIGEGIVLLATGLVTGGDGLIHQSLHTTISDIKEVLPGMSALFGGAGLLLGGTQGPYEALAEFHRDFTKKPSRRVRLVK